jgi:hypothetical protein
MRVAMRPKKEKEKEIDRHTGLGTKTSIDMRNTHSQSIKCTYQTNVARAPSERKKERKRGGVHRNDSSANNLPAVA